MSMPSSHPPRANIRCSPQNTDTFLREAETLILGKGQRFTRIRRKVLKLLIENTKPIKAYELMTRLDGMGAAKPPTIYRALDFLQNMGLVHKLESLNAYVSCGHISHPHSAVFLICDTCQCSEELYTTAIIDSLKHTVGSVGFHIRHPVIEVRGICRNCAQ